MDQFVTHMRILKRSEVTIAKRVELIERLRGFLSATVLDDGTGAPAER